MSITRSQLIVCAEVDDEIPNQINVNVLPLGVGARWATRGLTPQEAIVFAGELIGTAAGVLGVDRGEFDEATGLIGEILNTLFDGSAPAPGSGIVACATCGAQLGVGTLDTVERLDHHEDGSHTLRYAEAASA